MIYCPTVIITKGCFMSYARVGAARILPTLHKWRKRGSGEALSSIDSRIEAMSAADPLSFKVQDTDEELINEADSGFDIGGGFLTKTNHQVPICRLRNIKGNRIESA